MPMVTHEEQLEQWKLDRLADPKHGLGWQAYAKDLEQKYLEAQRQIDRQSSFLRRHMIRRLFVLARRERWRRRWRMCKGFFI
jgi:hypothetical protein